MRKILLIFVIFNLLLTPQITNAESEKETNDKNGGLCQPVYNETTKANIEKYQEDEASIQESYTIDIISSLLDFAGINSVANLVFGNPYCIWSDKNVELVYGMFTVDEQTQIINPMVNLLKGVFSMLMVLTMMIVAIKLAYGSMIGRSNADFWDDVKMWFVVILFIVSFNLFIEQIFIINHGIVQGLRSFLEANGIDSKSLSIASASEGFSFTDIIVFVAEWLLSLYLNFIYIFRKVVILLMIIIAPIAGYSLLYPSTRNFFGTWVRELCGLIFLQSFHALILTVFLLLSTLVSGASGTVFKMILLVLFIPLTGILMSWLKLSESNEVAHKFGMSGISSLSKALKVSKYTATNNPLKKSSFATQAKTRISELAGGKHSKGWNMLKSGVGKTGAILGGTAGIVLGPQGVMLGSQLGKGASLAALQGSRNIGAYGLNVHRSLKDFKGNSTFKDAMKDIGKRRNLFGNLGEANGALFGLGDAGRNIGHALSGVSRQRILNSNETGGFGGVNLEKFNNLYPDQNVKWLQDNKGSAFYLDHGNDNLERISPLGAADPSLKNGLNREIDYKFSSITPQLQKDANGQYHQGSNPMLNGSTNHLHRTSDAFIKGSGDRVLDSTFNASNLNPDDYYKAGLPGTDMRSTGDRVADTIHGIGDTFRRNHAPRHKGFL